MSSILNTTKEVLGLLEDYTPYDAEIIIHINSVLGTLQQLGVGPEIALEVKDADTSWEEFFSDPTHPTNHTNVNNPNLNAVKQYVPLKVKLVFDPPATPQGISALERVISELEFRLLVAAERYDKVGEPKKTYPYVLPEPPIDGPIVVQE